MYDNTKNRWDLWQPTSKGSIYRLPALDLKSLAGVVCYVLFEKETMYGQIKRQKDFHRGCSLPSYIILLLFQDERKQQWWVYPTCCVYISGIFKRNW